MYSNIFLFCLLIVNLTINDCIKYSIDINDILAENFMPEALLLLENPKIEKRFNQNNTKLEKEGTILGSSLDEAMKTMSFHRNMMNQYLCRSYVAEEIVNDMTVSRVKRRMGHVTPGMGEDTIGSSKFQLKHKNNLLNDEGSTGYQDWLTKSTTLEDIYRHYDHAQNKVDKEVEDEDEKNEDFDEDAALVNYSSHKGETPQKPMKHRGEEIYYSAGEELGYPYSNPYHQQSSIHGYHHVGSEGGYSQGENYGYGGGGYLVHEPVEHIYEEAHHEQEPIYHSYLPKYQEHYEHHSENKDKDLTELFEIALTALAYLSFGMFIVHVIMCISSMTNNSTTTATSVMMPMSMSPTATAPGGMTNTGGGSTTGTTGGDGGTPGTGNGGGTDTGTGGGTTATGGGSTGGTTSTGSGGTGTGDTGTGDTGTDNTGTDGDSNGSTTGNDNNGTPGTGDGATDTGTGGDNTDTGTGGGTTGTDTGSDSTGNGSGDTATGTTGNGDGGTSTGGGTENGGGTTSTDTTGSASPDTGTGAGGTAGTGTGTSTGDTATGALNTGSDTFKFRLKRNIPTITNPNTQALNELARKVLISIESVLVANYDEGVCLKKNLCENNKWSRTLEGREKIVIPLWSLGMSWLSGRLVKSIPAATSMIDSLKASILGLGNANCDIIYQKCDLAKERLKRRRRRRKRNAK